MESVAPRAQRNLIRCAIFSFAILAASALRGGDTSAPQSQEKSVIPAAASDAAATSAKHWEFSSDLQLDYGYAGGGEIGSKRVNAQNAGAQYVLTAQYNDAPPLRIGADWERFDFSHTNHSAIPGTFQSESLITSVDFEFLKSYYVRLEIHPGFYSASSHPSADDFDIPIILGGSYIYNANLQIMLGLEADPERKYPVLPGGGFRWQIDNHWTANAVLPKPRIEYEFSKSLVLYGGANFLEDSYRANKSFSFTNGRHALRSAWVDYTEVRVGAGISLKLNSKFSMDLESGYTIYRDFDFHRSFLDLHTHTGGVYGAVSLTSQF